MIHVYSQDRDLVVYLFINQLISFLLTFFLEGGGGGGVMLLPFHFSRLQTYLFLSLL